MADPVANRVVGGLVRTAPGEGRDTPSLGGTEEFRALPDQDFPRPFGRYELRALLGRGGMGAVYLAHDSQLDRLVALKIPRIGDDDRPLWRERFLAEARAAATLHHPNICPVFEVGEADSRPYLTMAYIEGETLSARLRRTGPPTIPGAVALVRTITRAMAEAHDRGIVHRDLKPANVIIDKRGQPVVMDFGLALRPAATDDLRLTLSGVAMGTPAYMSPEQAGGDHDVLGPPTDVYALGVILYELVTGRVPFQGKTFGKLLAQIERDPPPLPSALNAAIDPALEAIIVKALEKAPERRFATAGDLADALDAYARGEHDAVGAKHGAAKPAGELTGPYIPAEESNPPGSAVKTVPRRRRWITVAAGVIGISLAALLAWVVYQPTDKLPAGVGNGLGNQPAGPQRDPPRPVEFPKQATLIEIPGWQILTDATKAEMQQWLDDRKKDEHSVVWLDAVQVGETPVFAAAAALDDRATKWVAFLDLTEAEINNANLMIIDNRLKGVRHVCKSLSGFARTNKVMAAVLFYPGGTEGFIGVRPIGGFAPTLTQLDQRNAIVQIVRPFPVGSGQFWFGFYGAAHLGLKSVYGWNLNETELSDQLEKYRSDGYRPVSVVGYPNESQPRFAVTYQADATKSAWEVHRDLTAADLKSKAPELARRELAPASVTAYPWDGAVRYAAVWVKEPPREK